MQIRVIFALPSLVPPSLGALGSCPSRPPLDPPLPTSVLQLRGSQVSLRFITAPLTSALRKDNVFSANQLDSCNSGLVQPAADDDEVSD